MKAKRGWTVLSFFTCFLWNLVLLGAVFYAAERVLFEMHRWVNPFLVSGTGLPENAQSAFANLNRLLSGLDKYLAPAVFGGGGIITLLLWLTVMFQGRRLADRAGEASSAKTAPEKAKSKPKAVPSPPPEPASPPFQSAVQMLSILQREGRLIDFLQEDLSAYEDSQIGAAVRNIHQGCKDALTGHVELKPIYQEAEGVSITVPPGFDSRAVRLTGNVTGNPPFKGVLRHRGWRVARIELPKTTAGPKEDLIVAPAEVEVE
jgi:hypothetical protein